MEKSRETFLQAVVAAHFTVFAGYLMLIAPPGWKQIVACIGFGAVALWTARSWYAAFRNAVNHPGPNPDGPSESN